MEAATPIPALPPALRELGGACVGVVDDEGMDAGGVGELVEDMEVDADTDAEGVDDWVMLLLVDEIAEDNVVELDTACLVKDCGEGA